MCADTVVRRDQHLPDLRKRKLRISTRRTTSPGGLSRSPASPCTGRETRRGHWDDAGSVVAFRTQTEGATWQAGSLHYSTMSLRSPKLAAASVDDVGAAAGRASVKAAGVVVDDTAVTPAYVQGLTANRELPIIGKIAKGSLRNKLLLILPAALILSAVAPLLVEIILMIGGTYLCYEGAEKIHHRLTHGTTATATNCPLSSRVLKPKRRWLRAPCAPTSSCRRRSW